MPDKAPPPVPEEPEKQEEEKEQEPPRKPERIYGPGSLFHALNFSDDKYALSDDEYQRLMRYAYYRMRGIRGRVCDTDARDLLHEAIVRTREQMVSQGRAPKGIRAWNPRKTTLFNHLLGCMRSIGNELVKKGGRFTASSEWIVSPEDIHRQVEAKVSIQRLRVALRGDTLALAVLESMVMGETPQEAQARLKIAPWDYEKGRKRVIRRGRLLFDPEGNAS